MPSTLGTVLWVQQGTSSGTLLPCLLQATIGFRPARTARTTLQAKLFKLSGATLAKFRILDWVPSNPHIHIATSSLDQLWTPYHFERRNHPLGAPLLEYLRYWWSCGSDPHDLCLPLKFQNPKMLPLGLRCNDAPAKRGRRLINSHRMLPTASKRNTTGCQFQPMFLWMLQTLYILVYNQTRGTPNHPILAVKQSIMLHSVWAYI